jgi:hypothetical protein
MSGHGMGTKLRFRLQPELQVSAAGVAGLFPLPVSNDTDF